MSTPNQIRVVVAIAHLKEAVDTYREALTVLSKDKSPELWGKIQDNLKIARLCRYASARQVGGAMGDSVESERMTS